MAEYKDEFKAGGSGVKDLYETLKTFYILGFENQVPLESISKIEIKITYKDESETEVN